jgi:hypothetical protein
MKNIIIVAFIFVLSMVSAPDSSACWCFVPAVSKSYDKASDVFTGVITEIDAPHNTSDNAAPADKFFTIKFKVEKSWKGRLTQEISVLADQGRLGCFSYPTVYVGDKYLVYADPFPSDASEGKDLVIITACNRTGPVGDQPRPSLGFAFDDWSGRRWASKSSRDWLGREYRTEDLKELDEITNPSPSNKFNPFSSLNHK